MCTRFVLLKDQLQAAYVALGVDTPAELVSRYNIAPSTTLTAFRRPSRTAALERATLRWGLVPSRAKSIDASAPLVNARSETLTEKPSFRDAFRHRRCLIPAGGFYEWAIHGRARRPWLFQRPDAAVFFFAGLWERWCSPTGEMLESCAIITTTPNAVTRPIHDRMPVLLAPDATRIWLDPEAQVERDLIPLLQPAPDAVLTATALSTHVSNVRHDDPACLKPTGPEEEPPAPQLSLGF
jgi:putative SOS response-associated peptidase YedK